MAIELNHTIINSADPEGGATWLAEVLGLDGPQHWGPFWEVKAANGINLDYHHADGDIQAQHYAFLISEDEFDGVFSASRSTARTTSPTRRATAVLRSTTTTVDAGCTSGARTATGWRSSHARTAVVVGEDLAPLQRVTPHSVASTMCRSPASPSSTWRRRGCGRRHHILQVAIVTSKPTGRRRGGRRSCACASGGTGSVHAIHGITRRGLRCARRATK